MQFLCIVFDFIVYNFVIHLNLKILNICNKKMKAREKNVLCIIIYKIYIYIHNYIFNFFMGGNKRVIFIKVIICNYYDR